MEFRRVLFRSSGSPRTRAGLSRAPTASTPSGARARRRSGSPAACRPMATPMCFFPRERCPGLIQTMRRLGAEEKALWEKVVASVRPLHAHTGAPADEPASVSPEPRRAATPKERVIARPEPRTTAPKPGVTLDAGWDRRLGGGPVQPDIVVDLISEEQPSELQSLM